MESKLEEFIEKDQFGFQKGKYTNIVRVIKCRRLRWAGHVARMEEGRSLFKILTDKSTGSPRRRWEDNIKMDLKEIRVGINKRNWVDSAHDRD